MSGHVMQRPVEAIRADLAAAHARHDAEVRALLAELSGTPERAGGPRADPTAERKDCKAQAAHTLGMTQQDLTRFLVRYARNYPDRPKLFIQPAGMKGGRWVVFTERVKYVRETGEPY